MNKGTYKPTSDELKAALFGDKCPGVVDEAMKLAATVIEISADYDVRHMTPNELAKLSARLYEVGAIGFEEYAVLSFQPEFHDGFDENSGFYQELQAQPDQPRDFIAEWQKHLWEMQRSAPGVFSPTMAVTREIIELLKCFTSTDT
jgi:hypothetical protein